MNYSIGDSFCFDVKVFININALQTQQVGQNLQGNSDFFKLFSHLLTLPGLNHLPSLTINTGAPQDYVLSPFHDQPPQKHTAILALLTDKNYVMDYHTTVTHSTQQCEDN